MSFDLNKQQLIGTLGKDAEARVLPSGTSVSNFSVATTDSRKGKDGNYVDTTTWHNIVGFNLSDYMLGKLIKGAKVYIEGRTQNRSYEAKDGTKRYVTEVVSERVIPLSDSRNISNNTTPQAQVAANVPAEDDLPF